MRRSFNRFTITSQSLPRYAFVSIRYSSRKTRMKKLCGRTLKLKQRAVCQADIRHIILCKRKIICSTRTLLQCTNEKGWTYLCLPIDEDVIESEVARWGTVIRRYQRCVCVCVWRCLLNDIKVKTESLSAGTDQWVNWSCSFYSLDSSDWPAELHPANDFPNQPPATWVQ